MDLALRGNTAAGGGGRETDFVLRAVGWYGLRAMLWAGRVRAQAVLSPSGRLLEAPSLAWEPCNCPTPALEDTIPSKKSAVIAAEKGYRVEENGDVISPKGRKRKPYLTRRGFYTFSLRLPGRKQTNVSVHQLVAFQKYGMDYVESDLEASHVDGDLKNNAWDNIKWGTHKDTMNRREPEVRQAHAQLAANARRHLTEDEARDLRRRHQDGESGRSLAERFGIRESTVHYIVTGKTYREVC